MTIPRAFIDDLLTRVRVSDIVGKRVTLKRAGKEFSGLCPFHNEKSPSFTVNDEKGFYHCFGCGAHGDALRFITETEGKNYPEAIETLAQSVGLSVPRVSAGGREDAADAKRRTEEKRLKAVTKLAAEYFTAQLRSPAGEEARAYLERRGIDGAAAARFGLGYARDGFHLLEAFLREKGVSEADMRAAGLCAPGKNGGLYDRFRHRVIFPIRDLRGDVVAFGGRALGESAGAKYLNSPEGPLFDKSALLYNIAAAGPEARKSGALIVTEGYMDVCVPAAKGAAGIVASMGTAIGKKHLDLLWRYCDTPVICMDGDDAGRRAAARVAENALPFVQAGRSLAFVALPEGTDPADYALKHGGEAFAAYAAANARPIINVLEASLFARFPGKTPEEQAARAKEIERLCQTVTDRETASLYRGALRDAHWTAVKAARRSAGASFHGGRKNGASFADPSPARLMAGRCDSPEQCEHVLAALLLACAGLQEDGAVADDIARIESVMIDKAAEFVVGCGDCADGEDAVRRMTDEEEWRIIAEPLQAVRGFYGFSGDTTDKLRAVWFYVSTKRRFLLLKNEYNAQLRAMTEEAYARACVIRDEMAQAERALRAMETEGFAEAAPAG